MLKTNVTAAKIKKHDYIKTTEKQKQKQNILQRSKGYHQQQQKRQLCNGKK